MSVVDETLAIWPRGGFRAGTVPLISPQTGMVGHPTRTPRGVDVTVLYNPSITFGGKVEVKSSLTPACGIWQVASLDHTLESATPDGAWFSRLSCLPIGFLV